MKLTARYTLAGETKDLVVEGDKLDNLCKQFLHTPETIAASSEMTETVARYELDFGGILTEEQEDNGIFAELISWNIS